MQLLPWSGSAAANFVLAFFFIAVFIRTVLSYKTLLHHLRRLWRCADEITQAYQYFDVPRLTPHVHDENPLFRKAAAYVASLPSLEDADTSSVLSSASKPNDFSLQLGPGHAVVDAFQGARLAWSNPGDGRLVLRVRRHDRARVLRPYLQHVESVADELDLRRRDLRLYTNGSEGWTSVSPFTHPATFESIAMDGELKSRVRADLDKFLAGRNYYHRLGRVWRRSYLLHGAPGTGKSTFAAAMARYLRYDIYNIDLSSTAASVGGDLRSLLMRTTPRSIILVEDLDRYLHASGDTASSRTMSMLNFMDGIASCCAEERVMVFTMTDVGAGGDVDPAVLRPGRVDVHIRFPMCDFEGFKAMASSYLGLTDHPLYQQVEERFNAGGRLSAAEVGEIMLANRGSPNRALRNVITALQRVGSGGSSTAAGRSTTTARPARLHEAVNDGDGDGRSPRTPGSPSSNGGSGPLKEAPTRDIKNLYGLIKLRSRKDLGVVPIDDAATPLPRSRLGAGHSGNLEKLQ